MAEATGGREALQSSPAGIGPSLLVTGLVDNPGEIDLARVRRLRAQIDMLQLARLKVDRTQLHEVLGQPGLRLGRNDPNHDPMGYYTVLVCALAEDHYGLPGLRHRLLGDDVNPEQVGRASLTGLADGSLDAMFLYRSAAIGRPFGFIDLPTAINLGDAGRAAFYARAEFRTSDGHEFRGTPISFGVTVLRSATSPAAALRFVEFLISPAGLEIVQEFHFISSPILAGGSAEDPPPSLATRVQGGYVAW